MKLAFRSTIFFIALAAGAATSQAAVVSFGTGSNQFQIEFVTIGNPGNAADTTGAPNPAGAVGYTYGMAKFEISENIIAKYNANFGTANSLKIDTANWGLNKAATYISWNEAARFVNWLNTSTGGFNAYKFTSNSVKDNIVLWTAADALDYDATNPYRSKRANYVLPSCNEWYKAAYYDPINSIYYDYPTGSNTAPTAVASGTAANTAVYAQISYQGPADVDQAGGLSPYGVMGLGGNVFEWEESSFDLANGSGDSNRGRRSGMWSFGSDRFLSSYRMSLSPTIEYGLQTGIRVVRLASFEPSTVPEPSMMVIGSLFGVGGLKAKRRMKK